MASIFSTSSRIGFLILVSLCLLLQTAKASHIRAGEILYRHLSGNTYEIILRGYTDRNSSVMFGSNGSLEFGDGNFFEVGNMGDLMTRREASSDTWFYELKVEHTYPAPGHYVISYRELYRNEGVFNMDNSVNMPFYIESSLYINPLFGPNNSPVLARPPVDKTMLGATYHHQPGAFDPDGDSLAYRLVPSHQDQELPVANYRDPHLTFPAGDSRNGTNETGGAPYFTINPYSGDVIWDAPGIEGEYNYALIVEEWRRVNGQLYNIGSVMRDMQIVVEPTQNNGRLQFPFNSTTITPAAEEPQQWIITATAQNPTDSIALEIWGDFIDRASANVSSRQMKSRGEASITINWKGEADLEQNYQLIARTYNPQAPELIRARSVFIYPRQDPFSPLGEDEDSFLPIQLYPNPLKGKLFFIQLPKEAVGKEVSIELYDTKGKKLQQHKVARTSAQLPVHLNQATPGLYILHCYVGNRSYKAKLIVQ